jgi:transcriptional regulator with XRE-family HTH domain
MRVNQSFLKAMRTDKGWTQQQLADVSGLSLRTIQRIENQAIASNETVNAMCAVFAVERSAVLTPEDEIQLNKVSNRITAREKIAYFAFFVAGVLLGSIITASLT